jgi:peroxiredoxin
MAWPHPGEPAPNFTLPDTANVMHTFPAEYAGKVALLFFWETW